MRRAQDVIATEHSTDSPTPQNGPQQWAVIGHGRSPERQGWGERIDACDTVIRMWNCHWQDPADYGTRYDWGLLEVHATLVNAWKIHNKHTPAQGWIGSLLLNRRGLQDHLPPNSMVIDQRDYFAALPQGAWGCGETGQWQLTRGGVAACWAISSAKAGDTVTLVGFDVIKAGIALQVNEAFSPDYQDSAGFFGMGAYKPGKALEGNHDYAAELRLIEAMAVLHSVAVRFAQDIWPVNGLPLLQRPVKKEKEHMKFIYRGGEGAYGSGATIVFGTIHVRVGEVCEIPDEFVERARRNPFFEEVETKESAPVAAVKPARKSKTAA